jgi:hypothetical protein
MPGSRSKKRRKLSFLINNLYSMNFVELNNIEILQTQGGGGLGPEFLRTVFKRSVLGAIVLYVADNWSDVKQAVSDAVQDHTNP